MLEAREPSAKFLGALQPRLVQHFELLGTAPGGVAKLRELILTLAMQGKLVPQDPRDEPARELLEKIGAEKNRLVAEGRIKRDKPLPEIADKEKPFDLPTGWVWQRLGSLGNIFSGNSISAEEKQAKYTGIAGIPFIATKDVGYGLEKIDYQNGVCIPHGETKFKLAHSGSVLICAEGGSAGKKCGLVEQEIHFGNKLFANKTYEGILPKFILFVYLTPYFFEAFKSSMTGIIGGISLAKFLELPIPLPPLAEQARIVTRIEELMRLCDALEAKGQLEAAQHAQLVQTLLGALTASTSPEELADNWQRVATHFDLLLDRPEAIDALEQTVLQLAVRGLLVPQDPKDEPASELLKKIRAEKDQLIAEGKVKQDKPLELIEDDEKPFALGSGWAWIQAQEACDPTSLITYGILKPVWVDSGVLTVRVQDMKGGEIRLSALGQCSPERAEKFDKTKLVTGDLLIAKDGATLGKTAFVPPALEGANITQHVLRFPINSKLNRQYIRLVVDSEHGQAWMKSETKGVALPGVNVGDFRRMPIPLPPINEQARIIERVESLRRLCADLRERLAACQATQAHLAEALIDEAA